MMWLLQLGLVSTLGGFRFGFFRLEDENLYPKINHKIVWLPLFPSPRWCLRGLDYFSISGTIFPENTVGNLVVFLRVLQKYCQIHWNGPKSLSSCCLVLFPYQQTRSVASHCCNPSVPQMWKKCSGPGFWVVFFCRGRGRATRLPQTDTPAVYL